MKPKLGKRPIFQGGAIKTLRAAMLLSAPLFLMGTTCQQSDSERLPVDVKESEWLKLKIQPSDIAVTAYDGKLGDGWYDFGWAPRSVGKGPVSVNMSGWGGWIVAHPGLVSSFDLMTFQFKAPKDFGDFLQVQLASQNDKERERFPRILITKTRRKELPNGFMEVILPISALNPNVLAFDRVIFMPSKELAKAEVLIDKVMFTKSRPVVQAARTAELSIDCGAAPKRISPYIYGIAYSPSKNANPPDSYKWKLNPSGRRWGGNASTRFNWKLGNAWNTGFDWYFENINYSADPKYSYMNFLEENQAHDAQTALVMPMIGWVARDTTSYSFSVVQHGPQKAADPYRKDAGNGVLMDGSHIKADPQRTSIPAPPAFIKEWVSTIRTAEQGKNRRNIYILDNEPMLWNTTHRDVHPEPATYDELLDRTIRYATAIREGDPDARIAGPALWGWTAYFYSAKDLAEGSPKNSDRRAHGDMPLLAWYLQKLNEHEKKTGTRMLDLVDVHIYPQAKINEGPAGEVSPGDAAKRVRGTRALWDPSYVDESWIAEPVRLLPRLQAWIDEYYPGRSIQLGEYNFGGDRHISGGIAQAEAMGRFAEYGVFSAFMWMFPSNESPVYWGFRAYRNYDGQGGRFLDFFVPSKGTPEASLFVSRDEAKERMVAIAINLSQDRPQTTKLTMTGCKKTLSQRTFRYTGDPSGFKQEEGAKPEGDMLSFGTLPPFSITVVEARLDTK